MAVFICCADESSDRHQKDTFFYGGFAATVEVWDEHFMPAWTEHVLEGPPPIDYLHMADITRPQWQAEHGLTWLDADNRIYEAARVIGNTGGLVPIVWSVPYDRFYNEIYAYSSKKTHSGLEEPDYLAFLAFAYSTLVWLQTYRPEVESVDFWVEQNGKISTRIGRMHTVMSEYLTTLGRSDLAALIGEFLPVSKRRIQAQAADTLCWHERNAEAGTLDRAGWHRRGRMVGYSDDKRDGLRKDLADVLFDDFAKALVEKFPQKIRRVK